MKNGDEVYKADWNVWARLKLWMWMWDVEEWRKRMESQRQGLKI